MLMAAVGVTRQRSGVRSEGWEPGATRVYTGKQIDADGEKYKLALVVMKHERN